MSTRKRPVIGRHATTRPIERVGDARSGRPTGALRLSAPGPARRGNRPNRQLSGSYQFDVSADGFGEPDKASVFFAASGTKPEYHFLPNEDPHHPAQVRLPSGLEPP